MSHQSTQPPTDVPLGSNEQRLSPREWLAVGLIVSGLLWGIPRAWEGVEPLDPSPNARGPHELSRDYWTHARRCRAAASEEKTLVIGDSVVWGAYVTSDQTLSAHLNRLSTGRRFANLGVQGLHPAAMAGLVECYMPDLAGRHVVLQCDPLWMASDRRDLTIEKEFQFNHPQLVPQFVPRIPCYREPLSVRLAAVIERNLTHMAFARHLRIAYFDNSDAPHWTLDHPAANPAEQLTLAPPSSSSAPSETSRRQLAKANFPWVELNESLQWSSFQRTVDVLQRRGARVFVLVGPLNEHQLTPESRRKYATLKARIAIWLESSSIPHYVPPPLAATDYADVSHPLSAGYARLAQDLLRQESFASQPVVSASRFSYSGQ